MTDRAVYELMEADDQDRITLSTAAARADEPWRMWEDFARRKESTILKGTDVKTNQ
jgi:hypothetical protein